MNHDHDLTGALGAALRDRAEGFVGAPLTLDQVRGTARGIRRRRRLAAAVATVAAVAVVAVPTVLTAAHLDRGARDPEPIQEVHVVLTGPVPRGADPSLPYVVDGTLVDGTVVDGPSTVNLPAKYTTLARVPEGWVGLVVPEGGEVTEGAVIGSDGSIVEELDPNISSPLVGSPDHTAAAWVDRSGDLQVWSDGAVSDLGRIDPLSTWPLAVVGDRVLVNRDAGPALIGPDGESTPVRGVRRASDVTADGRVAGTTNRGGTAPGGGCARVIDPVGATLLERCDLVLDQTVGSFSPDGSRVVAGLADENGSIWGVRLLTTNGGEELAALDIPEKSRREIGQVTRAVWEDDEHLLVTTQAPRPDGVSSVYTTYRFDTDGSIEQVLDREVIPGGTSGLARSFVG